MESIWTASIKSTANKRNKLGGHKKTNVLIIGGGIAGILTAYKLKEALANHAALIWVVS